MSATIKLRRVLHSYGTTGSSLARGDEERDLASALGVLAGAGLRCGAVS